MYTLKSDNNSEKISIILVRKVAMWAISLGVSLAPIRSNLRLLMDNDLGGAGAYCNHVDSWGYGG